MKQLTDAEREEWHLKIWGWNGEEFHEEAFKEFCAQQKEEYDSAELEKAMELWAAGWKSETPYQTQNQIMSWFWRRPGPRGGRRFHSTDQALTHLRAARAKS